MTHVQMMTMLISLGMSKAGAAAMMGNIDCESNAEACRVQGDFDPSRRVSRAYAQAVDSGTLSPNDFARDAKGWGMIQWTYWSRKQGLLNYAKSRGVSIADPTMQLNYIVVELKSDYPALWQYLTATTNLYEATRRICVEFERPAINNIEARFRAAQETLTIHDAQPPKESYWPPRMLCKGMSGPDVSSLQGLLTAHGYTVRTISGVVDEATDKAIRQYQQDDGLTVDGIAGPMTWASILKM